jgi:hypothetical protein
MTPSECDTALDAIRADLAALDATVANSGRHVLALAQIAHRRERDSVRVASSQRRLSSFAVPSLVEIGRSAR